MNDIYERLKAPFPPDAVSWRVGSTNKEKTKGMALAYIDARDVMNRLDEVCSPAGWMDRYEFHGTRTVCYLSIAIPTNNRPDGDWITKADGAGDSDVEAEKGSISDSFKRAAVKWGIGRYLYDLPSPWVALNQYKQIEPQEFDKLRRLLAPAKAAPPPAPPAKAAPKPAPETRAVLNSTKAPDGVNDALWQNVVARVMAGMDAYEDYWKRHLTQDERDSLIKHHDALKRIASGIDRFAE